MTATSILKKQKFYGIDVVRGAATCLVALAHASWRVAEPRNFGVLPFHGLTTGLFVSVDFFFVLSGFLIAWVHWKDIGRPDRGGNYFKRRFSRIYPIYWVVLTLFIIGHFIQPGVTNPVPVNAWTLITSYVIIPNSGPTILGVAWTLYYEIWCYLVFAFLLYVGFRGFWVIAIWSLAIIAYYLTDIPKVFPYSFFFQPFNLQFLSGIAAAYVVRNYSIPYPRFLASVGLLVFILLVLLQPGDLMNGNQLAMRSTFGILACAIIAGLIEAERSGRLTIPQWLQDFGAGSYSIYLVHTIVQPPFLKYGGSLLHHLNAEFATIAVASFSIGVGYAFHRVVELPMTRQVQRLVMGDAAPSRIAAPQLDTSIAGKDAAAL